MGAGVMTGVMDEMGAETEAGAAAGGRPGGTAAPGEAGGVPRTPVPGAAAVVPWPETPSEAPPGAWMLPVMPGSGPAAAAACPRPAGRPCAAGSVEARRK